MYHFRQQKIQKIHKDKSCTGFCLCFSFGSYSSFWFYSVCWNSLSKKTPGFSPRCLPVFPATPKSAVGWILTDKSGGKFPCLTEKKCHDRLVPPKFWDLVKWETTIIWPTAIVPVYMRQNHCWCGIHIPLSMFMVGFQDHRFASGRLLPSCPCLFMYLGSSRWQHLTFSLWL